MFKFCKIERIVSNLLEQAAFCKFAKRYHHASEKVENLG